MDTSYNESSIAQTAKRSWRRHSAEFRTRVIELARQPNTSMAAVALANGLNANMLRRWVREAETARSDPSLAGNGTAVDRPAFVPVAVFHRWLLAQRRLVPTGSATMKAIDYLRDVLTRIHGHRASHIDELLPRCWQPG